MFVTKRGHAKILDFGLAKVDWRKLRPAVAMMPRPCVADGGRAPHQSGRMLGTVAYMSPSRYGRKELDTRTDLFSFGIGAVRNGHRQDARSRARVQA